MDNSGSLQKELKKSEEIKSEMKSGDQAAHKAEIKIPDQEQEYINNGEWSKNINRAVYRLKDNCGLNEHDRTEYGKMLHYEVDDAEKALIRKAELSGEKSRAAKGKGKTKWENYDEQRLKDFNRLRKEYDTGITIETAGIQKNLTKYIAEREKEEQKEIGGEGPSISEMIAGINISSDIFDFKLMDDNASHIDAVGAMRTLDLIDKVTAKIDKYKKFGLRMDESDRLSKKDIITLKMARDLRPMIENALKTVLAEHRLDMKGKILQHPLPANGQMLGNTGLQDDMDRLGGLKHGKAAELAVKAYRESMIAESSELSEKLDLSLSDNATAMMKKLEKDCRAKLAPEYDVREKQISECRDILKSGSNNKGIISLMSSCIGSMDKLYVADIEREELKGCLKIFSEKEELSEEERKDKETIELKLMLFDNIRKNSEDNTNIDELADFDEKLRMLEGICGRQPLSASMCSVLTDRYKITGLEKNLYNEKPVNNEIILTQEEKDAYKNDRIDDKLKRLHDYRLKQDKANDLAEEIRMNKMKLLSDKVKNDAKETAKIKSDIGIASDQLGALKLFMSDYANDIEDLKSFEQRLKKVEKSADRLENLLGWRKVEELSVKEQDEYRDAIVYLKSEACTARKERLKDMNRFAEQEFNEMKKDMVLEGEDGKHYDEKTKWYDTTAEAVLLWLSNTASSRISDANSAYKLSVGNMNDTDFAKGAVNWSKFLSEVVSTPDAIVKWLKILGSNKSKTEKTLESLKTFSNLSNKVSAAFKLFWNNKDKVLQGKGLTKLMGYAAKGLKSVVSLAADIYKVSHMDAKKSKGEKVETALPLINDVTGISANIYNACYYIFGPGFSDSILGIASKGLQASAESVTMTVTSTIDGALKSGIGAFHMVKGFHQDDRYNDFILDTFEKQKSFTDENKKKAREMLHMIGHASNINMLDTSGSAVDMMNGILTITLAFSPVALLAPLATLTVDTVKGAVIKSKKAKKRRRYTREHFEECQKKMRAYSKLQPLTAADRKHVLLQYMGAKSGKYSEMTTRLIASETGSLFTVNKKADQEQMRKDMLKAFDVGDKQKRDWTNVKIGEPAEVEAEIKQIKASLKKIGKDKNAPKGAYEQEKAKLEEAEDRLDEANYRKRQKELEARDADLSLAAKELEMLNDLYDVYEHSTNLNDLNKNEADIRSGIKNIINSKEYQAASDILKKDLAADGEVSAGTIYAIRKKRVEGYSAAREAYEKAKKAADGYKSQDDRIKKYRAEKTGIMNKKMGMTDYQAADPLRAIRVVSHENRDRSKIVAGPGRIRKFFRHAYDFIVR